MGKKAAIIGYGPAGLACADQFHRAGHTVTIVSPKPPPLAPGERSLYSPTPPRRHPTACPFDQPFALPKSAQPIKKILSPSSSPLIDRFHRQKAHSL
ncbi:hypothetical protein PtA15_2A634 [Puccinia triticina]|uniref:Ketopantoate reductase N-terminal domain-containing protein n=1 Tax=Puccinia triticina TaxID=208348 RepID=A0ABY7CHP6_9BASI|nr:uncharacterized protein PtA15_2A634 [Puccinia triticina]WAQ82317.1 hypothetical protein PtA15_2A634 [Puccinia triticina]